MEQKEILGAIAAFISLASCPAYMWGIYKSGLKPHAFSWTIWGLITSIVFAAQVVEGAGAGAWNMGAAAAGTWAIAIAAFFYGERNITRSDWAAFVCALAAIPVWVMTKNPLPAVIIVSAIDSVSYWPTLRKSWIRPREESALMFVAGAVAFFFSLFAQENRNLTTLLYPVVITCMNILLIAMLLTRRRLMPERP